MFLLVSSFFFLRMWLGTASPPTRSGAHDYTLVERGRREEALPVALAGGLSGADSYLRLPLLLRECASARFCPSFRCFPPRALSSFANKRPTDLRRPSLPLRLCWMAETIQTKV